MISRAVHHPVQALLAAVGLLSATLLGFVTHAPNRLLSGQSIALGDAVPSALRLAILAGWTVLLLTAFVRPRKPVQIAVAVVAAALWLLDLTGAGQAARDLAAASRPVARTSLGPAFWLMLIAAALVGLDALQRLRLGLWSRAAAIVALAALTVVLAASGALDQLSIAKEYANHDDVYLSAWVRHVGLVAAAVVVAALFGVPLGLLAQRRPRSAGAIFGTLNVLQTIPSIALFALLIGPLSSLVHHLPWLRWLGVGGIGAAPATIALALYALLPVSRSTQVGLEGVPPAVREAARGMGMSRWQILRRVEWPLAWPALLAGLRVVTVQTTGLAAVAALIGAGGLGSFVFLGLGQNASDLVLLGALSIIALALALDGGFQLLLSLNPSRA